MKSCNLNGGNRPITDAAFSQAKGNCPLHFHNNPWLTAFLIFVVHQQEKEDALNVPVLIKFVMLYTCNLKTSSFYESELSLQS